MTYATAMVSLAVARPNDALLEVTGQVAQGSHGRGHCGGGGRPGGVRHQVEDVVGWLSRHGIVARAQTPEQCGNAVVQPDRVAADTGGGIVLAGAYGHSRFREWVPDGVTQQLVAQTVRCALLSR